MKVDTYYFIFYLYFIVLFFHLPTIARDQN